MDHVIYGESILDRFTTHWAGKVSIVGWTAHKTTLQISGQGIVQPLIYVQGSGTGPCQVW